MTRRSRFISLVLSIPHDADLRAGCLLVAALCGILLSSTADAETAPAQVMPTGVLSGAYSSPKAYPRVFESKAKALAFLTAAQSDSNKNMVLLRLTAGVKNIIATAASFDKPYVGTDINAYLSRFSAGKTAAAPAAAQLALYVYLTDLDAGFGSADIAATARNDAQLIMQNWVTNSFHDADGNAITSYDQFTSSISSNNAGVWASVGLQIGRGMVYFTDALDLLNDGNAPADFIAQMNDFVEQMLNLEIGAANYHYDYNVTGCARFDNQASMQDLSLAAMGRYVGRSDVINALAGTGSSTLLEWSFPQQIEGNIYGTNDTPRTCNPPTGAGASDFFQVAIVSPGEIVDRFRALPYHPFGYTLGSLTSMELTAVILTEAGYRPAAFVGNMGQSLRTALDYYGWYVTHFLSADIVSIPSLATATTAEAKHPDFTQYAGDIFTLGSSQSIQGKDAMLTPFMLGTRLYPHDTTVGGVLARAQALATANTTYADGAMDIVPVSVE